MHLDVVFSENLLFIEAHCEVLVHQFKFGSVNAFHELRVALVDVAEIVFFIRQRHDFLRLLQDS